MYIDFDILTHAPENIYLPHYIHVTHCTATVVYTSQKINKLQLFICLAIVTLYTKSKYVSQIPHINHYSNEKAGGSGMMGVKKKHRYRPGTMALCEICHYQKSTSHQSSVIPTVGLGDCIELCNRPESSECSSFCTTRRQ